MIRRPGLRSIGSGVLAVLALLLAGCGGGDTAERSKPESVAPPVNTDDEQMAAISADAASSGLPSWRSYVATGRDELAAIEVFKSPGGDRLTTVPNRPADDFPAVFLVRQLDVSDPDGGGWFEVWLPVRPNGSHGFVRAEDVSLSYHAYKLRVNLTDHKVQLFTAGVLTDTYQVGIGDDRTPTPGGTFYTTELLKPTNRGGPYGTYAYGLSGFSNTLTEFAGGDGVVGLHGTDEPGSVGRDVSAGCIRMRNSDIEELVDRLPLGVPVEIVA